MTASEPSSQPSPATAVAAATTATPARVTPPAPTLAQSRGERVVEGLRRSGLIAIALLVAGALTARLHPIQAPGRDFNTTPFVWAAVLWIVVMVLHALLVEQSQLSRLERQPLLAALVIGVAVFGVGIASFGAGSFVRRLLYLGANAVGAIAFWWAIFSLFYLLQRAVRD